MRKVVYKTLDHTADVGIIVRAPDARSLYADAALAMFDLVTDLARVRPREALGIEVQGVDREDLLVRWLGDLLSLHDATGKLFCAVEIEELTDVSLRAIVSGEPFDPARHSMKGELKAATHHGALVSEDADGWSARVVFDV